MTSMAVTGAMSGTRPGDHNTVELSGGQPPSAAQQAIRAHNNDIGPAVKEMVDDQVKKFGPTCVNPTQFKGIPGHVLVRNAKLKDFDTGVVRSVGLDEAMSSAKAGKAWVLKSCA